MDLGGTWTLKQIGTLPKGSPAEPTECAATVPGEVHCSLIQAGIIDDPHVGYRELEYRWVGLSDWEYSRSFEVDAALLNHSAIKLNCDSIDTIATISINGTEIGKTENMFRAYSFDVKSALVAGSNSISVKIQSAATYAKDKATANSQTGKVYPLWEYPQGEHHRNHIRKCGCHFGWDWGPCFVPAGSIKITATSIPTISHITACQQWHSLPAGPVDLTISVHLINPPTASPAFTITISFEDQVIKQFEIEKSTAKRKHVVRTTHRIENPKVWWPNGWGTQELCSVRVEVSESGAGETKSPKEAWNSKVGLRHLELDTSKDKEIGEKFQIVVNGRPMFAKGADWIPADSFQTRITPNRLRSLLTSAREANFNMLRVWGGGIYESDEFYNICDEYGILLWQDMMFACALYPATPSFLKNVKKEVKHQVRRLAIHPSIALWCGNNENEEAMAMWEESKKSRDKYVVDYHMLYIETILPAVTKVDPTRSYWPSSPSNGVGAWGNSQDPTRGDTHYWGVWHSNKPFTEYLTVQSRFCSEFGFQSLPRYSALREIIPPVDGAAVKAGLDEGEFLNLSAPFLEYKQRSPTPGNKGLLSHVATHFRVPKNFEQFVYVSQVLQALSIKTACEHFRRQMPNCMGSLYWQLNDIWEGPSWSSLEYDGSWKILHNLAAHFYSPVLVSTVENGENLDVWVTNDGAQPIEGFLNVDCWRWDANEESHAPRILRHVQCKEGASLCVWSIPIQSLLSSLHAELKGMAYKNLHFFTPLKSVTLHKATITHEVSIYIPPVATPTTPKYDSSTKISPRGPPAILSPQQTHLAPPILSAASTLPTTPKYEITLHSDRVAPYVYLQSGKFKGKFSDNGFLLLPGEERKVQFSTLEGEPLPDMSLFASELLVHSLRDSY